MPSVLPPENTAVLYSTADPKMLLRIIDGEEGPGLVSLETLRQISAAVEADLADRLHALEVGAISQSKLDAETQARVAALQALSKGLADEVAARVAADSAEATARTNADTTEATTRANADTAEAQARSNADAAEAKARADAITAEATTRAQALAALAARGKALEDKPALRIVRYNAVTNASGIATFVFNPAFTTAPDVDVIDTWTGEQIVTGGVLTFSTTGCTVQAMVSRGTLLLTAGPFTKAGANVSVTVRAIGT